MVIQVVPSPSLLRSVSLENALHFIAYAMHIAMRFASDLPRIGILIVVIHVSLAGYIFYGTMCLSLYAGLNQYYRLYQYIGATYSHTRMDTVTNTNMKRSFKVKYE